jgi:hypothetical protein
MSAFFKTLFGDARNLSVVTVLLVVAAALVHGGYARETAFVLPPLVLVGIAWLAPR